MKLTIVYWLLTTIMEVTFFGMLFSKKDSFSIIGVGFCFVGMLIIAEFNSLRDIRMKEEKAKRIPKDLMFKPYRNW